MFGAEKELQTPMRSVWRWKIGSSLGYGNRPQPTALPTDPLKPEQQKAVQTICRHLNGDGSAFPELIAEFGPRVYGYLTRCGVRDSQRDDLFQEVFLRVHRAASTFDQSRPFAPWLFTIVANVTRSHFRKEPRNIGASSEAEADPDRLEARLADADEIIQLRETAEFLDQAISDLPEQQREVLLLSVCQKLELQEIAEVLGLPLGTVKTNLRRARLRLAERLAKQALRTKREVGK